MRAAALRTYKVAASALFATLQRYTRTLKLFLPCAAILYLFRL